MEPQDLGPEQASEGQGETRGLGRASLGLLSEEGTVRLGAGKPRGC